MDSDSSPESGPSPRAASGSDIACSPRLLAALVELVAIGSVAATSTMRLRLALKPIVRDARAEGLRPEQFVVLAKNAWAAQPGLNAQDPVRHRVLHDKLITACIAEYFAPESTA